MVMTDYTDYDKEFQELNELRHKFWNRFRDARNRFLREYPPEQYSGDPEWIRRMDMFTDLERSCMAEDIWRQQDGGVLRPKKYAPPDNENEDDLFDRVAKATLDAKQAKLKALGPCERRRTGLYETDRLCRECWLPFEGRPEKKYCSERCRGKAKAKRWREKNPDKKREAERRYLNSIFDQGGE